jgi:hypothetical protein
MRGADMQEPRRIWWARPRKLCALERPGGGGRSHRPARRHAEIAYLKARGVRLVVSTMTSRHNLAAYETVGLGWHHVAVESCEGAEPQLEELLRLLRIVIERPDSVRRTFEMGATGRPDPIRGFTFPVATRWTSSSPARPSRSLR